MAEGNVQEKKSSSKLIIILLIVLILLLIGGIVTAIVIFGNRDNEDEPSPDGEGPAFTIAYEANGIVALSPDELQAAFDAMVEKAEDGTIGIQFKHIARSRDGVHFNCYIGNSVMNSYDMYLDMYLDHDLDKEMLLTGLIPPGSAIETFESTIPVDPGEHEATLVFTQIEDDHSTIRGQTRVTLILQVGDFTDDTEDTDE